ncbi:unnamed protein product [Allacma fusca]|uniref:Brain protein I3 n=1 Tax=Allacma fusca TaxID=39272 RepID=A0A8J2L602_9HEXA|nr:unnamed protein product [Allacma fusca]
MKTRQGPYSEVKVLEFHSCFHYSSSNLMTPSLTFSFLIEKVKHCQMIMMVPSRKKGKAKTNAKITGKSKDAAVPENQTSGEKDPTQVLDVEDLSEDEKELAKGREGTNLSELQTQEVIYVNPQMIVPHAFMHCPYCHEGEIKRHLNTMALIGLIVFFPCCFVGLLFLLCLYENRCNLCGAVLH